MQKNLHFATCKLTKAAKACLSPGMKDYEALLWLLGYIRNQPAYGVKFYANANESPVHAICQRHNVPESDVTIFSDASWQDCPDTGRSTIGYLIFSQGGLIEANSSVPVPVAMSSAESEYMGACTAAMAGAHVRMLVYDYMYLGTPSYSIANQRLATPPTILMVDNQAAVKMSANDQLTRKSRHIERRFHYVREGQSTKMHSLHWCPGEDQLADIMTKTQSADKIDPHLERTLFALPAFLQEK